LLQALQIGFAGSKFGQPVFQHGAETALGQGWHPIAKTERLQCTGDTVLTTPQIIDLPVLNCRRISSLRLHKIGEICGCWQTSGKLAFCAISPSPAKAIRNIKFPKNPQDTPSELCSSAGFVTRLVFWQTARFSARQIRSRHRAFAQLKIMVVTYSGQIQVALVGKQTADVHRCRGD